MHVKVSRITIHLLAVSTRRKNTKLLLRRNVLCNTKYYIDSSNGLFDNISFDDATTVCTPLIAVYLMVLAGVRASEDKAERGSMSARGRDGGAC